MKNYATLLIATLTLCCSSAAQAQTTEPRIEGKLLINGNEDGVMRPGQPAVWTFFFKDPRTGRQINNFAVEHEKYMHLIAVSRDLETFGHLHPALDPKGHFILPVNMFNRDPDNQDAERAVAKPGTFFLFSEIKPQGMGLQQVNFTLTTSGQERLLPLEPDPMPRPGVIQKFITEKGSLGRPGDPYQVTLAIEKMPSMTHLTINVQGMMNRGGHKMYMPVTDLEPWLGMMGHAILIGGAGNRVENKVFRHLHAGGHHIITDQATEAANIAMAAWEAAAGTGPDLLFMMHGRDLAPAGLYKAWVQFKHHGQIITVPFIFDL